MQAADGQYFNSFNAFMRKRFGGRTAKISLDLGVPCPHRLQHPPGCIYCRPHIIMPEQQSRAGDITAQLNRGIEQVGRRYDCERFIAYFQNETNTAGETGWLTEQFKLAADNEKVVGLIISTRPDCIDEILLDRMAEIAQSKPLWLELGLQSTHDQTLQRINRGHSLADFERALAMANIRGLPVGVHMILGLPGETPAMMAQSFTRLAAIPIDSLKIHHMQVYADTKLEQMWRTAEFKLIDDIGDYIPLVADLLELLPWRIRIQRIVADSPQKVLLAPKWNLNKNIIIKMLEDEFARRGSRQGSRSTEDNGIH